MKNRAIFALILLSVFILVFGYISIFGISVGVYDVSVVKNIQQGLDLTGGVSAVFEAVDTKVDGFEDKMDGAVAVFRNRLDQEGYTEATVTRQGSNQIRVEIPINESSEIQDPEQVIDFIGSPAKLEFKDPAGEVIVSGEQIASAKAQRTEGDQYVVAFKLKGDGADKFAQATAANIGKNIGIFLDGNEISSPKVNSVISGGEGVIEGGFTVDSARQLAIQIESGALPIEMKTIEVRSISGTLGEDALSKSVMAGIIGLVAVMIFMIVVYRVPGVMSDISLIIYLLINLFCLATIPGVQLSLPGIAGIILSIGMAVDANVIIFERIKDELKAGHTVENSIEVGFQRAFSSILDSNVTTLIAAGVLYFFGTGAIKGFAITLAIGVVVSMFTTIVVTKFLLRILIKLGVVNPSLYTNMKGVEL